MIRDVDGDQRWGTRKAGTCREDRDRHDDRHSYESTARFYDAAYAAMPSLGPDAQFYEKLATNRWTGARGGLRHWPVLLPIATRGIECAG